MFDLVSLSIKSEHFLIHSNFSLLSSSPFPPLSSSSSPPLSSSTFVIEDPGFLLLSFVRRETLDPRSGSGMTDNSKDKDSETLDSC